MKIIIDQRELAKHINIAQKGISSRSTLQILDGILIETIDNKLKLTATDLEISIETFVECDVIEEGSIVVNSRIFGDIIKKLPDDNVHIEVNENNINIKCSNSEFNIIGNEGVDYPNLPIVVEKESFSISKDLFKSAIRQVVFATSTDETRASLTGVLLEIENDKINFVALDGYRLSLKTIKTSTNIEEKIIVPAKTLNELNKILEDREEDISISISSGQVIFNLKDTKVYSKLLEGQFFNYKDIMRQDHKSSTIVNRNDFKNALERASLLAKEEKANLVKLNIENSNIIIKSNSEIGDVNESIRSDQEGEDLNIAFNSRYILEGIKTIQSEEIILNFMGSLNPCIINGVEDNTYTYLVLPVRLAQDEF